MNVKYLIIAGVVSMTSIMAATSYAEDVEDPRALGLSDAHIAKLLQTIEIHIYRTPPGKGLLHVYDPTSGETLRLRHIKTYSTGDCLRNLGDGLLLICSDYILDGQETEETENVDIYQVAYLVEAETFKRDVNVGDSSIESRLPGEMKVLKTGLLGKNGKATREWFKDASGKWETRVLSEGDEK